MEDIGDIELGPTLWGAHVTEAKPVPLESGERRLTVFRATLEKGNKAQLFLSIKGEKYALGTLAKDKKEYTRLDLEVFEGSEDPYEISVVGDGTVALVGSYSPSLFNDESDDFGSLSDDDIDLDDEDEEDEVPSKGPSPKGKPAPKAALPPAKGAAAHPPKGAQPPAAKGAAAKPAVGGAKPAAAGAKPAQPAAKGQPAAAKGAAAKPAAPAKTQSPKPATTTTTVSVTTETKTEVPEIESEKVEEKAADTMEEDKSSTATTPEKKNYTNR